MSATAKAPAPAHGALTRAVIEGDRAAVREGLAPDAVLRSPVTGVSFEGRDVVAALLDDVSETFEAFRIDREMSDGDDYIVVVTSRVLGRDVGLAQLIHYDDSGRVSEMRLHSRPLAGSAAVYAALAPRVVGRRNRALGIVLGLLLRPLPLFFALGDRFIDRLGVTRA
jgi:hypothetical protein